MKDSELKKVTLLIFLVNQNKVRNWINNNFIHVLENLEYGREELPLMLKIIDYLRSIDSKIGNPVNSFQIMVRKIHFSMNICTTIFLKNQRENLFLVDYSCILNIIN